MFVIVLNAKLQFCQIPLRIPKDVIIQRPMKMDIDVTGNSPNEVLEEIRNKKQTWKGYMKNGVITSIFFFLQMFGKTSLWH